MGVINRIAPGLLDLLQSKTDGKNPRDLSETVAPTLNIEQFYLAEKASVEFLVVQTFAIGATVSRDVEAGEIWFLYAIDTEWIAAAIGNRVQLSVEISRFNDAASALSAVTVFAPPTNTAVIIGEVITNSIVFDRPLPLTAGMRLSGVTGDTNLITNVAVNFAIYRMKL